MPKKLDSNGLSYLLGLIKRAIRNSYDTFGASGKNHSSGLVPDPGQTQGTTKYLREDGTWAVPVGGSGGGGAVSSVNGQTGDVVLDLISLESTDSTANSPDFDSEAHTIHVTAQTLSTAQKTQARTNIGAADASTAVNSTVIRNIVNISQTDYDALSSKDNTTLYIII